MAAAAAEEPEAAGGSEGRCSGEKASPRRREAKPAAQLLEAREARRAALEQQHLTSCGKQVTSARPTVPCYGFAPPRVLSDKGQARCGQLSGAHEGLALSPRPVNTVIPLGDCSATVVVKGFGHGRRFMDDDSAFQIPHVLHDTKASPFSPVFPYQEEDKKATSLPSFREEARLRRHSPQATRDLNSLHVQCSSRPAWSFGSAGLGERFGCAPDNKHNRAPPRPVQARLPDVRVLRENMASKTPRTAAGE